MRDPVVHAVPSGAAPSSEAELGVRLRGWRQARRLSIRELSGRTGISVGLLSQIERGISSPSVRNLRRIGAALDLPLAWMFEAADNRTAEADVVVRAGDRRLMRLGSHGVSKYLLTPFQPAEMETLLIRMEPDGSSGPDPFSHAGEECGYVLSGAMALHVEDRSYTLQAGDSYRFKATRPHRFDNAADGVTEVIMTISPPFYAF